jgi:hypothetical protein
MIATPLTSQPTLAKQHSGMDCALPDVTRPGRAVVDVVDRDLERRGWQAPVLAQEVSGDSLAIELLAEVRCDVAAIEAIPCVVIVRQVRREVESPGL